MRRASVDLVMLIAIAVVLAALRLSTLRHGLSFEGESTWYFHFGGRILEGDAPYRDFVFPHGPAPIYIDAAFQRLFGARYTASLFAALAIHVIDVWMVWLVARRFAGWAPAAALVIFWAFDPPNAVAYHWYTTYVRVLLLASALCLVVAQHEKRAVWCAAAGACAGLLVLVHLRAGVVVGIALIAASAILSARRSFFDRRRFVALCVGYVAVFTIAILVLARAGAFPALLAQLAVPSLRDALDGNGFLIAFVLPAALVAVILHLLVRQPIDLSTRTLALLAIPFALLVGLLSRYLPTGVMDNLPRCVLLVGVASAVALRSTSWFGVSPVTAIALALLPLAANWAIETATPGPGPGDAASLLLGVLLLALASGRASARSKLLVSCVLAIGALVHAGVGLATTGNPFAGQDLRDGRPDEIRIASPVRGSPRAILHHVRLTAPRARILEALAAAIPAGSSCFFDGNSPIMYDLLGCTNPVSVDAMAPELVSAAGGRDAVLRRLRAHPPDYLVTSDLSRWPELEAAYVKVDVTIKELQLYRRRP